ncbi:MAG: hypothetical protein JNM09_15245 [Blastocatellia bacterium]|nr:hypothetical protein [Blastocatellia bacterium]
MEHKVTLLEDDDYDLDDDAPAEIDFDKVRFVRRGFHPFAHVVPLDEDVAAYFTTPQAVNEALRRLMHEMKEAA